MSFLFHLGFPQVHFSLCFLIRFIYLYGLFLFKNFYHITCAISDTVDDFLFTQNFMVFFSKATYRRWWIIMSLFQSVYPQMGDFIFYGFSVTFIDIWILCNMYSFMKFVFSFDRSDFTPIILITFKHFFWSRSSQNEQSIILFLTSQWCCSIHFHWLGVVQHSSTKYQFMKMLLNY